MAIDSHAPGLDVLSESFGIVINTKQEHNDTASASLEDSSKAKTNGHVADEVEKHDDSSTADQKGCECGKKIAPESDAQVEDNKGSDTNDLAPKDEPKSKEELEAKEEFDKVAPGSISSAHNIYWSKNEAGDYAWTSEYPKDIPEAAENSETAKYAVVTRYEKSEDSRKKLEAHSVIIQSPLLKETLGEILHEYPGVSCELQRLVFYKPFKPFLHRWSDMLGYLDREDVPAENKKHLKVLVDILTEELGDSITAFQDYLTKGITTYDHAWMLFQPGSLVVSEACGPISVYELIDADYVSGNANYLQLQCEVVEWSGSEFGRHTKYLNIPEFKGVEKITNLPSFPLPFHKNKEALKASLIERGKKFEALAGHHFRQYNGVAITWNSEGCETRIHHSGRIVIDCKSFNQYSPYSARYVENFNAKDRKLLERKTFKPDPLNPLKTQAVEEGSKYNLSSYHHLLCNFRVRGYSLSLKRWLDFFVHLVEDIDWNTRAFDSLVLPEDQKELILAFAESQVQHRDGFDDVMKGKGQGIIILLSGRPGIGKTLTAESVAESMKRPLHTISSGDLGANAWDIEKKLTEVLDLVGRWNAVLLLDECDVFLEARSTHDLDRNAMVSTFLRVLEYYQSILFLTTNRADNIDPAFESRIHVSMQYPDLTAASRERIWTNFLSTQDHALSDSDITELAEIDLNGRQIKNIVKTSHLLSKRKMQRLCMQHINTVLDIENRRPEKRRVQAIAA